jgi:two-component system, NarL family, sensor histidine kinase UhpB
MRTGTSVVGDRHQADGPLFSSVAEPAPVLYRPLPASRPASANGTVRSSTRVEGVEPHAFAEESAEIPADSLARSIEADVKRFVARELHDQVVQTLTTMLLDMESFKAEQSGHLSVQDEVSILQDSVRGALNQIRTLLYDLRSQPCADTDFVESVRASLVAVFEKRTGIQVTLSVSPSWPAALAPRAAMNLYRAVQEALNNVRLHAAARAVQIGLEVSPEGEAIVTVVDDGSGLEEERRRDRPGLGLVGMRERAVLLGGDLSISSEPGQGTIVRMVVPREGLT